MTPTQLPPHTHTPPQIWGDVKKTSPMKGEVFFTGDRHRHRHTHTHIQTDGHRDSMTESAQLADSVKTKLLIWKLKKIIENQVFTLKYEVEELKKIDKEKLENVRVEARSNSKQLAQLINTIDDVVQRLKILEQEHTEHTEEEAVVDKARAETERKTYKDQNESTD